MNQFLRLVLVFIIGIFCSNAQNQELSDFIPEGYVLFTKYFGDLNNDGQADCVLIIKNTDEKNMVVNRFDKLVDRNRRGIILLLKNGENYQLTDKNYDCFFSENEDGGVYYAPQLGIELIDGHLIVSYEHGRYGNWNYIFSIDDSTFKLIGYHSISNYGPITNKVTSINFLTKKKLIKENINENTEVSGDEVFKETEFDVEINNLIKLSEIKYFSELELDNY